MGQGPARRPGSLRGRGEAAPTPTGHQPRAGGGRVRPVRERSAHAGACSTSTTCIVACADALAGDREFADSIRWRTRHLFVDEMQDVNPAQFRLLTTMLADEPDLFVVGDPNQSVYGFNGADPTLLDRLPEILRGHQGHPPRREPPLHASGGGGGDRRAARRRGGGCGDRAAYDAGRRAGAQSGGARLRGRRGIVGGRTGQDVADAGAAVVEHRRAHPDERPARQGAGGNGRRPGAEPDRRGRPRPGHPTCAPRTAGGAPATTTTRTGSARNPCDRDRVVLTTFHRAKGLQWPTVIIVGLQPVSCRSRRPRPPRPSTKNAGSCTWP